jgi:hypothetical protein
MYGVEIDRVRNRLAGLVRSGDEQGPYGSERLIEERDR